MLTTRILSYQCRPPPRGYSGTCILCHRGLNHLVTPISDGSDRITATEIATPEEKLCLICVYMYARGTSDGDVGFLQVFDELHEIVEKFRSTHRIIIGGDFNSSLHCSSPARRDRLLKKFLEEHSLRLPDHYPEKVTYRHDGTGASALIDYWVLSNTGGSMVVVGDSNPINLSDHVHVSCKFSLNP